MKMLGYFAAAVLGVGGVAGGQPMSQNRDMGHPAGAKRPMTFADLMAMKRVSDPQVSASGKWVLFSVTEVSLEKNTKVNHLWVVPLQPTSQTRDVGHPDAGRQITFGEGESNGRFSPDGRRISLTMKDQIFEMAWEDAAGTVGAPVQVTRVNGGADGAVWSPDSKRLMFVASVYPECSDKPAWAEEDACDQAKQEAADASPVKAQLWTSLLYRHWNAFTGLRRSHVAVVNAADGSGPDSGLRDLTPRSAVGDAETPTFSLGGPLGYAWAPDSHEIAYVTNLDKVPAASTNNDVFTLRLDEGGAKAVKVSTSLGSDDGPSYSPDGKWLAFRSQARAGYESDRFRLMVMDRKNKSTRELMPNFDGWVDEFVWSPFSTLFFTSAVEGKQLVFGVDPVGGRVPGGTAVYANDGEYGSLAFASNAGRNAGQFVAVKMTADRPAEIVSIFPGDFGFTLHPGSGPLADRLHVSTSNGRTETQLTHLNEGVIEHIAFSAMESYRFTGAEGAKVQGFVVKPPNFNPKKKYPVKFLIHGGPQGAWGDAWSYRWNPELMAASGYVVVMVNPRGSTGYGQAFIDGVNGDWGGKAYVDLMKGLDAAEAQFPFLDKDRECALGASYGGFMANWILTHPDPKRPDRFKCIVTHDGMYDPRGAYGSTEELWFNEWEFRRPGDFPQGKRAGAPGQPWRYEGVGMEEDPFRKWSPMLSIADAKTPTLVIHSQKDYRLDVSQGLELFTALQRLGVPSEMLYFPDEGHWVMKPRNAELWNKTVGDWCDRWTKSNAYAGK